MPYIWPKPFINTQPNVCNSHKALNIHLSLDDYKDLKGSKTIRRNQLWFALKSCSQYSRISMVEGRTYEMLAPVATLPLHARVVSRAWIRAAGWSTHVRDVDRVIHKYMSMYLLPSNLLHISVVDCIFRRKSGSKNLPRNVSFFQSIVSPRRKNLLYSYCENFRLRKRTYEN